MINYSLIRPAISWGFYVCFTVLFRADIPLVQKHPSVASHIWVSEPFPHAARLSFFADYGKSSRPWKTVGPIFLDFFYGNIGENNQNLSSIVSFPKQIDTTSKFCDPQAKAGF